jgi:hypothetical protein
VARLTNFHRQQPRWPPGRSNEAYLSSPHLEASPAMTFRACSSPAPTPIKPQPAPAILSQESVHTTLSITHHTRKRPSTGPRTTHGPQKYPHRVYRLKRALYGLKQVPRAWHGRLRGFLVSRGFVMGTMDRTLFLLKQGNDLLIV